MERRLSANLVASQPGCVEEGGGGGGGGGGRARRETERGVELFEELEFVEGDRKGAEGWCERGAHKCA